MKKLLLITFLLLFTCSYAQQTVKSTLVDLKNQPATITSTSAYPNPFATATKINFQSTKQQLIEFSIKDLLGKTIYLERFNAKKGTNKIPFNRNNLKKGMYIYSLQTETEIVSKRLIIK